MMPTSDSDPLVVPPSTSTSTSSSLSTNNRTRTPTPSSTTRNSPVDNQRPTLRIDPPLALSAPPLDSPSPPTSSPLTLTPSSQVESASNREAPVKTTVAAANSSHQTTATSIGAAFPVPEAPVTASSPLSPVGKPFAGSNDIEMAPIQGHRRRRSSLMNPTNAASGPSRPRAQSIRIPQNNLGDEQKILEEQGEGDVTPISTSADVAAAAAFNARHDSEHDSFSDEDLHDDEETGLTKKDKKRKQKKRKNNTLLDQRIAREKSISSDEKKEADRNVVRRILVNVVLILLWYMFSLSISLYNKWMFDAERLNFPFPLFTTSTHMLVQFSLASLVLYFFPSMRPQSASDLGRSRHEAEPNSQPIMSKMFYLTRIGPCGAATGLDIGLGNMSLKFISLTFYTMCKSSSLAFVLIFAFAFRLEKPTWRLVGIIAVMIAGVVLMVFGEVEFRLGGFVLVIAAAFFSGFRWGLTQILLLRNPATSNPFSSIFFISPIMFLTLITLAIPVEGFGPLFEGLRTLSKEWGVAATPLFLLFPGCLAFCMTAAEFALLKRTSVVTLSIAGIFKEVVTISAASLVFQDQLTLINFVGLTTTMVAIIAYNYIKIVKMREDAQVDVQGRHVNDTDGSSSNSCSDADGEGEESEETAGLLARSHETSQPLFTSDGDMQPSFITTPPSEERSTRTN